jgi:hypothetical protein
LFDLLGLGSSPFSIKNATPELNRGLVELTLHELELETLTSSLLIEKVHLLDMFLKRRTAYFDVIHARRYKFLATSVPQTPESVRDVALHLRRSRSRPKRHPKPLVKS